MKWPVVHWSVLGWGAALVAIILLLLVWFSRLVVILEYSRNGEDDRLRICGRALFGVIRWQKEIRGMQAGPGINARAKPGSPNGTPSQRGITRWLHLWDALRDVPEILRRLRDARPVLRDLLRQATFRDCSIRLVVGTGDVVAAGIAYGALWAVLGTLVGRLSTVARFPHPPSIHIEPRFGQCVLDAHVTCIVEIPTGYAIVAGLRLMRAWRRRMADGTSYPRLDANRHEQYS